MRKERGESNVSVQLLDKGLLRLHSAEGEVSVPYRLARSRRARALRLTIHRQNEVVLTLPTGCSLERGLEFMREKAGWLGRHLVRVRMPEETLYAFLRMRGWLSVGGNQVAIDLRTPAGEPFLQRGRGASPLVLAFDPERNTEERLKSLLRRFAADVLPLRSLELASVYRLPVNRVGVRDQISRWGSCSAKRNLSLNWRLILLPPEIQDYVIWHELAHLIEMSHSSRFWATLARFDPKAEHHDATLTRIGNRIMALGRTKR